VVDQASDTIGKREASAKHALEGYRERRRRRRAEDTYFGSQELLREVMAEGLTKDELDSRRASILEDAERHGVPADLAALLYDIAWEEGIDPAVGYELVRTGLGVGPPAGGVETIPEQPMVDRYLPTWMFPATPPAGGPTPRPVRTSS
jgi:hypothetical protein